MKKNFLAIASLLIAAMLLMVSCNQEVAPKNNLVEAKLSVGYGRDLFVKDDTNTSDVILKYSMTQGWKDTTLGVTEKVHGAATNVEFTDGGSIGYVTPGLWNITVDAYEKKLDEDRNVVVGDKIFTGTASAYFSNQNDKVKVYLAPVTDRTNSVEFKVTMQNLVGTEEAVDASGKGSFKLKYTLVKTGTSQTAIEDEITKANSQEGVKEGNTYYNVKKDGLASGFYRVTVSVYSLPEGETDIKNGTLVGGITKGFLLSNGANAIVEGHIEPSDYTNVIIDALYIDVNTRLSSVKTEYYGEGENRKATVTLKYTNSTVASTVDTFAPSTVWYYVDGTQAKGTVTEVNKDEGTYSMDFSKPGYKTISCQTIYTATYEGTEYTFADTKSIQVYIDPVKFEKAETVTEIASSN